MSVLPLEPRNHAAGGPEASEDLNGTPALEERSRGRFLEDDAPFRNVVVETGLALREPQSGAAEHGFGSGDFEAGEIRNGGVRGGGGDQEGRRGGEGEGGAEQRSHQEVVQAPRQP